MFFETKRTTAGDLGNAIKKAVKKEFGFDVPTLVKTDKEVKRIADAIPKNWENDSEQKTDVAYLFPEIDSKKTIDALPIKKNLLT